jgi:hypothetical protein
MVDGGSDDPGLCPSFGEVDCYGLLHLEHRLAMV